MMAFTTTGHWAQWEKASAEGGSVGGCGLFVPESISDDTKSSEIKNDV